MYQFDADKFAADVFHAPPKRRRKLARRVGVSYVCIWGIERGRNMPSIGVFLALCRELSLSPTDYITGEDTTLSPGSYRLDMDKLSAAAESRHMDQRESYYGNTPLSYFVVWRIRTGSYRGRGPRIATWMALCTWLQMPPSAFLVATK